MWKKIITGILIAVSLGNHGVATANGLDGTNGAAKSAELKVQSPKLCIEEEAVRKRMRQDKYTESQMITRIGLLSKVDARLQDSLELYLKEGTISDSFSVNGLTMKNIMKITGGDFFEAMSEMDRCIKKPELAKYAKNYVAKKHSKIHYDKAAVREVIKNELHHTRIYVKLYLDGDVDAISQYDEVLQPVLDQYMKDRTIRNEFAIDGVTIGQIMKSEGCDFFSALCSMNQCVENPFLAIHYTDSRGLTFEEE